MDPIDAREVKLALSPFLEPIRRVGEIDVAVGVQREVVRAVETLALVAVGEDRLLAVLLDSRHAAIAVLAKVKPALGVDGEAVGARLVARLAAARLGASVARRLQEDGRPLAIL